MYKKLFLIILGLAVVASLGLLVVQSNIGSKNSPTIGEPVAPTNPVEIPEKNPPSSSSAIFGASITLHIGDQATFPDGLKILLKEINDSRCPKDVQCIWAGELAGTFTASGGNFANEREIEFGTMRNKSLSLEGYIFSLKNGMGDSMTIAVEIKRTVSQGSCYVGGCSGQICSDQKDVVSTCEYREEYACYKKAKCEKQTTGECGWTQTAELKACLSKSTHASVY